MSGVRDPASDKQKIKMENSLFSPQKNKKIIKSEVTSPLPVQIKAEVTSPLPVQIKAEVTSPLPRQLKAVVNEYTIKTEKPEIKTETENVSFVKLKEEKACGNKENVLVPARFEISHKAPNYSPPTTLNQKVHCEGLFPTGFEISYKDPVCLLNEKVCGKVMFETTRASTDPKLPEVEMKVTVEGQDYMAVGRSKKLAEEKVVRLVLIKLFNTVCVSRPDLQAAGQEKQVEDLVPLHLFNPVCVQGTDLRAVEQSKKSSKQEEVNICVQDTDLRAVEQSKKSSKQEEVNICVQESTKLRRLFIGRLSKQTTKDDLKGYFKKWGEIVDVVVTHPIRSQGFGFVTFKKAAMLDEAQKNRPHFINGQQVEVKRAMPRGDLESQATVKKMFISGMKGDTTEDQIRDVFSPFGEIVSIDIIKDKITKKPKGFAFVLFKDYDTVDKCVLISKHKLNGKTVDVKKAVDTRSYKERQSEDRWMVHGGYGGGSYYEGGGYRIINSAYGGGDYGYASTYRDKYSYASTYDREEYSYASTYDREEYSYASTYGDEYSYAGTYTDKNSYAGTYTDKNSYASSYERDEISYASTYDRDEYSYASTYDKDEYSYTSTYTDKNSYASTYDKDAYSYASTYDRDKYSYASTYDRDEYSYASTYTDKNSFGDAYGNQGSWNYQNGGYDSSYGSTYSYQGGFGSEYENSYGGGAMRRNRKNTQRETPYRRTFN